MLGASKQYPIFPLLQVPSPLRVIFVFSVLHISFVPPDTAFSATPQAPRSLTKTSVRLYNFSTQLSYSCCTRSDY
eukprot:IDg11379t1